jgi:hypothetical protein
MFVRQPVNMDTTLMHIECVFNVILLVHHALPLDHSHAHHVIRVTSWLIIGSRVQPLAYLEHMQIHRAINVFCVIIHVKPAMVEMLHHALPARLAI